MAKRGRDVAGVLLPGIVLVVSTVVVVSPQLGFDTPLIQRAVAGACAAASVIALLLEGFRGGPGTGGSDAP
ncbi:MAG: hypothetical protein U0228_12840 [Myxococcaceae bacterium]